MYFVIYLRKWFPLCSIFKTIVLAKDYFAFGYSVEVIAAGTLISPFPWFCLFVLSSKVIPTYHYKFFIPFLTRKLFCGEGYMLEDVAICGAI